jgi:hypothetical protein
MNAVIDSPARFLLADSSAINVVVIYEDFLSGARAKHFAERLAEGLGSRCPLSESMWRSDLLDCPPIAAEAASSAADCEYLVISLRGDRVLTSATREWLKAQLNGAAGNLTCVIALLGSGEISPRVLDGNRHYLRGLCAENRVEFCAHAGMRWAEKPVPKGDGQKERNALDFPVRRGLPAPLDE